MKLTIKQARETIKANMPAGHKYVDCKLVDQQWCEITNAVIGKVIGFREAKANFSTWNVTVRPDEGALFFYGDYDLKTEPPLSDL